MGLVRLFTTQRIFYLRCYAFYDGGRCVSCNSYIGKNNCAVLQIKPWCVGKREDIERVLREEKELLDKVEKERQMKKRMAAPVDQE